MACSLCGESNTRSMEANESWNNGRDGISIGHKDTDNVFIKNVVKGNAHAWYLLS